MTNFISSFSTLNNNYCILHTWTIIKIPFYFKFFYYFIYKIYGVNNQAITSLITVTNWFQSYFLDYIIDNLIIFTNFLNKFGHVLIISICLNRNDIKTVINSILIVSQAISLILKCIFNWNDSQRKYFVIPGRAFLKSHRTYWWQLPPYEF